MKKLFGSLTLLAVLCTLVIIPAYANGNETTNAEPIEETMIDTTFVAFLGLLLGIVAAVFLPYIRKVYQGSLDANQWSNKYLLVIFSGFIMSCITTFILAPAILVTEIPQTLALQGMLGLFIVNFGVGFGQTAFIKEVFEFGKESNTATPAETST